MGLTRPRLGQFQTTTTAFDDEIIVLNNSATGTNANDIGIVFERGDTTNTALIWDESADTFALVNTTEQGSTQGNIAISSYSALTVGNLVSNGITFPLSDGTNGQSIVTDGSGNLSFSSAAGVVDWEIDQGATNIHANNYTDTNTTYTSSDFTHNSLTGVTANEHIDWTADQGATNIHSGNYTDTNTTYTSSDFTHNSLSGVTANEHIDWTSDQGATNIHANNYTDTNTTYSVGDGGLTQVNFTTADNSKLDGIASSATNVTNNNQLTNGSGYATTTYVNAEITNLIGGAPGALNTLNELAAAINDDASYASSITSSLGSKVGTSSVQSLSSAANAMTISGSVITLARGDGTTDAVTIPASVTNNNQLTNGAGYVTSSGNTVIGTDTDIDTSGATIIDNIYVTDGVITSMGTRTLTAGDISALGSSSTAVDSDQLSGMTATSANTANTIVQRDASGNFSAGTITGTATTARYADLAENYVSDRNYAVGTVLVFGGVNEVTISTTKEDKRIAGVVSSNPAYLMNSECVGEHIAPIALQGRVPCRVTGVVEKGDLIVSSSVTGVGVSWNESHDPRAGSVIGKSLENKNTNGEEIIEVVVGVR